MLLLSRANRRRGVTPDKGMQLDRLSSHALRKAAPLSHMVDGKCRISGDISLMAMNLLMKCNDIEETKSFYSQVLQFDVKDTAEGTCSVQKAGGTIVFSADDNLRLRAAITTRVIGVLKFSLIIFCLLARRKLRGPISVLENDKIVLDSTSSYNEGNENRNE